MSGVSRRQVYERASVVVVVAGVHLSAISIAAQHSVGSGADYSLIIELAPEQPQSVTHLPLMDARFDFRPQPQASLIIPPPSQTVPAPLPDISPPSATDGEIVRREPTPKVVAAAIVERSGDETLAFTSPESQATLRNILCGTLSKPVHDACDDWNGLSGAALAETLAPNVWDIEADILPVAANFKARAPVVPGFPSRKTDRFTANSYEVTRSVQPGIAQGPSFTLGAMAPVSQATRGMSGRATSRPHEIWGD